jgi:glycosyltransferase involved in cell wall biosynthesis
MDGSFPKILILSNTRGFGGSEVDIQTLVPHLLDRAQVHIVVENQLHYRNLKSLQLGGLTLTKTPTGSSPFHLILQFLMILKICMTYRPTYIIANVHKAAFLLAAILRLPIQRPDNIGIFIQDFDYYYLPFILKTLPNAWYLARTEAVIEDVRYQSWGFNRFNYKLTILPNTTELPTTPSKRAQEKFIACIARITPWKGIDYLIRAFESVARSVPEAQLRIYGAAVDEKYYAELKTLVNELKLENHIRFEPFTTNTREIYDTGSFFVVPSLSIVPGPETFCRIIIEAWASKKPVIAFATGGPRYLIENGVDGILVKERDCAELAKQMIDLWCNPEVTQQLGIVGYEKVKTRFNPERAAHQLLRLLESIDPEAAALQYSETP